MKKENNFWVDENNNRWDSDIHTEDQAKLCSQTMVNCQDCQDCRNCRNCWNCQDCQDCRNCQDCWNCQDCQYCWNCQDCQDCRNCQYCWNCQDCQDCRNCQDCQDWKSSPQRIVSGKIGSREAQTTVYFDSVRTAVVCGCFRGTLTEFEDAVNATYGDNTYGNSAYGQEYKRFIKKVKAYMNEEE